MKPIREFKSDEEFQKIAKDLQHKLFLDDWFIIFGLTDEPIRISGGYSSGLTTFDYGNREATILILNKDNWDYSEEVAEYKPTVIRNCALLNLLHELLHLKREYIVPSDILEDGADELSEMEKKDVHTNLEKMAKTLFMMLTGTNTDYFLK